MRTNRPHTWRSSMAAATQTGKRVLIVDDDFATCEMLSVLLAGDGYCVATACNGADALERLHRFAQFDLIVLDLKMPVMDGCAFCRRRQEDRELASVPLVVISGTQ